MDQADPTTGQDWLSHKKQSESWDKTMRGAGLKSWRSQGLHFLNSLLLFHDYYIFTLLPISLFFYHSGIAYSSLLLLLSNLLVLSLVPFIKNLGTCHHCLLFLPNSWCLEWQGALIPWLLHLPWWVLPLHLSHVLHPEPYSPLNS